MNNIQGDLAPAIELAIFLQVRTVTSTWWALRIKATLALPSAEQDRSNTTQTDPLRGGIVRFSMLNRVSG